MATTTNFSVRMDLSLIHISTPSKFFFSTNLAENTQFVRDFLLNESANSEGGGEESV